MKQKKDILLFMGAATGTKEAITYAKSRNVYTIVTDYNKPEKEIEKQMADEYWMLDIKALDAIEQRCRERNVTGIFAGAHEFCLDQTKELCHRLNLPFYASEEGWKTARDKNLFKKHCLECGVDIPKTYPIKDAQDEDNIKAVEYPVMVKPADSSGSQGIAVCRNDKELKAAIERAMSYSAKKEVVVEEYVEGKEIVVQYFVDSGEPILLSVMEFLPIALNDESKCSIAVCQSAFYKEYVQKIEPNIKRLIQQLQCKNGIVLFQAMRKNGRYCFFEMAHRLDGGAFWKNYKRVNHFSSLEGMVDLALDRPLSVDLRMNADFNPEGKYSAIYFIWSHPGKVTRIVGKETLHTIEGVEVTWDNFQIGDEVKGTGSFYQVAYNLAIVSDSLVDMIEKVKTINEQVHMYDENGQEMLIHFTDYQAMERAWYKSNN